MTELDDHNDYPLPDDWAGKRAENFNALWRDHLRHLPPLDTIKPEHADQFKEFAWKVYCEAIMHSKEVQKLLTMAYFDGQKDGDEEAIRRVKDKVEDFLSNLE